jgi:7-cyano-7-deazaguanine synthase in queuosine biosynthesis
MKIIKVQYLPATNTKGSRYKASIKDSKGIIASITEPFNYGNSMQKQEKELAEKLIKKMEWDAEIIGFGVYGDDTYFTIK